MHKNCKKIKEQPYQILKKDVMHRFLCNPGDYIIFALWKLMGDL